MAHRSTGERTLIGIALAIPVACLLMLATGMPGLLRAADSVPLKTKQAVSALQQASWTEVERGLDVIRGMTPEGLLITGYRISPGQFSFSVALQENRTGDSAKDVGEREGAVLAVNAGFFAATSEGALYPVGYFRIGDDVKSKGWANSGGLMMFGDDGLTLLPAHKGFPQNGKDLLQSRPMMIEPGGKWAMGSNLGEEKRRTLVCKLASGEIVLVLVTRLGLSLYEAGWMMRGPEAGGFFACDAAMALDGGRSTQVWFSGHPEYSFAGVSPVQNFLVVRQKDR